MKESRSEQIRNGGFTGNLLLLTINGKFEPQPARFCSASCCYTTLRGFVSYTLSLALRVSRESRLSAHNRHDSSTWCGLTRGA